MRMFLSVSGHSSELSIASHSPRSTVSQLKCVSDTISSWFENHQPQKTKISTVIYAPFIRNSNQMASSWPKPLWRVIPFKINHQIPLPFHMRTSNRCPQIRFCALNCDLQIRLCALNCDLQIRLCALNCDVQISVFKLWSINSVFQNPVLSCLVPSLLLGL